MMRRWERREVSSLVTDEWEGESLSCGNLSWILGLLASLLAIGVLRHPSPSIPVL